MRKIINTFNLKRIATYLGLLCLAFGATADPLLNGVATHTELNKEQFIAALYTETLSSSARDLLVADENKRMQVRILTDRLSSRRFKRLWIEGMAINSSQSELEKQANNMAYFSNLLKVKLAAGDIFSIERSITDGIKVFLNGTLLGTIDDNDFFDLLLRTWIGPVPLSSGFRTSLLSQGNINADDLANFEAIAPSDERIAEIEDIVSNRDKDSSKAAAKKDEIARISPPPSVPSPTVTAPKPQLVQTPSLPKPEPAAPTLPANDGAPATTPTEVAALPKKAPPEPKKKVVKQAPEPEEEEFTAASLLSQQLYVVALKRWSNKFLKYPKSALKRNRQGSVRLDITLDRDGNVKDIKTIKAAKYSVLTKAAIKAVNRASPFPSVPKEVKGEEFLFTLPILFVIKEE